jgi:hypothetical protein
LAFDPFSLTQTWKADIHIPRLALSYPLTYSDFARGASEYLEYVVARIDAPLLNYFRIITFNQFASDTPQLDQFIGRTPTLKAHDEAHLAIDDGAVKVILLSQTTGHHLGLLTIKIYSESHILSFHPCLPFRWWRASTSMRVNTCN